MQDIAELFLGILIISPQIAIVLFSTYYFTKTKSIDASLMTIGALLTLIIWIINITLPSYLYEKDITNKIEIISYTSYIMTFSSFVFALGLILMIRKHIKLLSKNGI